MDIDVKDPKVIRWLLAILVILIILPVYFFTSVLPVTYQARRAEIAKLEARHQELSRDLEKARLLVRNLARVEKEYEILHEQWSVAQMLLPQKNEMPSLLRKVTAAGSQSGVEFQLFRPQATVPREFYTENPVEVKVQGGYHQTGIFLSRLANLNRIVNVSALKLKGLDKQDEQPFTVEAAMTITAYTLSGAAATVAPPSDRDSESGKLAAGNKQGGKGTAGRVKDEAVKAAAGSSAGGR